MLQKNISFNCCLYTDAIIAHPQLVSRATGRVDMVQVMKNFPYLTVEQVSLPSSRLVLLWPVFVYEKEHAAFDIFCKIQRVEFHTDQVELV